MWIFIFLVVLIIILIAVARSIYTSSVPDSPPEPKDPDETPKSGFYLDTYYSLSEPSVYGGILDRFNTPQLKSIFRVGYLLVADKVYSDNIAPLVKFKNSQTVQKGWYFLAYPSTSQRVIARGSDGSYIKFTSEGSLLFLGDNPTYNIVNDILNVPISQVLEVDFPTNVSFYAKMRAFQSAFSYLTHKKEVGYPFYTMSEQNKTYPKNAYIIASAFSAPPAYRNQYSGLISDHIEDTATFVVSGLDILVNTFKIRVNGSECFNEPDGNWGTYMDPKTYGRMLEFLYPLKQKYTPKVDIMGPGLSNQISTPSSTLREYLKECEPRTLDAYSFHLWDNAYQRASSSNFNYTVAKEVIAIFKEHDASKRIYCTEFGKNSPALTNYWFQDIFHPYPNTNVSLWDFKFYPGNSSSFPLYQSPTQYPDAQDISPESVSLVFGTWLYLFSLRDLEGIIYWQLMDNGFAYYDNGWNLGGTNQGFGIVDRITDAQIKGKNKFLMGENTPHGNKPLGALVMTLDKLWPARAKIVNVPLMPEVPLLVLENNQEMLVVGANHFQNVTANTISVPAPKDYHWLEAYVYVLYPEGTNDTALADSQTKSPFFNYSGYRKNGEMHGALINMRFLRGVRKYEYVWDDPFLNSNVSIFSVEQVGSSLYITLLPGNVILFKMGKDAPARDATLVTKQVYCDTLGNKMVDSCNCLGVKETCDFWQNTGLSTLNNGVCVCEAHQ